MQFSKYHMSTNDTLLSTPENTASQISKNQELKANGLFTLTEYFHLAWEFPLSDYGEHLLCKEYPTMFREKTPQKTVFFSST